MGDRDVVIQFTKGLMDQLRDRANLSNMDPSLRWETDGKVWTYEPKFIASNFSAEVVPVKMIHFGQMFRVFAHDGKRSEIIGTFKSFDVAQDVAESFVSSLIRGTTVLIGEAQDIYGR